MKDIKEISAEFTKLQELYSAVKKRMKKPTPEEMDKMEKEMEMEKDPDKKKQMMMKLDEMKKMMKADMDYDHDDKMEEMMDYINKGLSHVFDSIVGIYNEIDTHKSGHWPKLTAGQLEKALNKCGLGSDFSVNKPIIYAKTNHQGTIFQVSLPSKK